MFNEAALSKEQIADQLFNALESVKDDRTYKQMRLRLLAMGPNVKDEVRQFRQLLKYARQWPNFQAKLQEAGFAELLTIDPVQPLDGGIYVQAFNHMIEQYWEE